MPFCFEQVSFLLIIFGNKMYKLIFLFKCGLILGSITLIVCALLTSYSCRLLIESSDIHRVRKFEFLAFKLFGNKGKIFLEIW
jgi:amino acid permease